MIQRILSLLIAGWYLYGVNSNSGKDAVIKIGFLLLIPLTCIWFSGILGKITGKIVPGNPGGCFIKFFGWFLLLLPFIYPYILKITERG